MILSEIISNYYKYKKITLLNILVVFTISILSYNYVMGLMQKDSVIFFIEYNTDASLFSSKYDELKIGSLRNQIDTRLQSYTNFQNWKKIESKENMQYSYREFITLRLVDDRLVIANNNTTFIPEDLVRYLTDYIEFTIRIINFNLTKKTLDEILNDFERKKCDSIQMILGVNAEYKFYSKSDVSTLINSLEDCIDTYTKTNYFFSDIYSEYENAISEKNTNKIQINNFINIGNVVNETISINNLKALNIVTYTLILILFSLIVQNIIIILFEERNKN
tara:strand:- start:299 stop:1132 length:834 start_codon:yes stop_codon:yes gene_type:complete